MRWFSNYFFWIFCNATYFFSCNSCAKPTTPIKLILIGGDILVGWTLKPLVEQLSSRSQDWITYIRVYIAPLGNSNIVRHLASLDSGYATLFPSDQDLKAEELMARIHRYVSAPVSSPLVQLPLAEAMLNCQDDSSQLFIPFVNVSVFLVILLQLKHFLQFGFVKILRLKVLAPNSDVDMSVCQFWFK